MRKREKTLVINVSNEIHSKTDGWVKEMCKYCIHIYNGILLSHKKEWNHAICSNMDATRDYHTKWSKSERERQIPYDITYMWNLKYGTGASLVAQWLRVCLPMQGTRVQALVWEDPTCRRATGPVSHNCWACASGACAPQQERPWQWKARAPRWRVAPACHN